MAVATVGIDLAKNVFAVHGVDDPKSGSDAVIASGSGQGFAVVTFSVLSGRPAYVGMRDLTWVRWVLVE
jgi:transposase